MVTIRGKGRHQICDIAVNEKFALIGTEDRRHMHAAVAAGNHHGAGALAFFCQTTIPTLVFRIRCRFPAVITRDQIVRAVALA